MYGKSLYLKVYLCIYIGKLIYININGKGGGVGIVYVGVEFVKFG